MNIVLDEYTRLQVKQLQPTQRDILSRHRHKTGYNVFQSCFYHDWNMLSAEEKKVVLISTNIHSVLGYDDEDSVVSDPPITGGDQARLCGKCWRQASLLLKDAWNDRAAVINQLPVIGSFTEVPEVVERRGQDGICLSMTLEYDRFVRFINGALKKKNESFNESVKMKTFGKESFCLQTQIFRSMFLNHLLKLTFFGHKNSKLNLNETVYKTSNCCVVHIASYERMIQLFTINEVCAFVYVGEDAKYTCGGKVVLKHRVTNKQSIGYVMSEDNRTNKMSVQLESGLTVSLKKPTFGEQEDGTWGFGWDDINDDEQYNIMQYWPIRFKLLKSGFIHMTLNKFKLRLTNNNLNIILL